MFVKLRKSIIFISIVKPTRCTNVWNLFYFGMTLYMFRTVFPSIIRSSRLYIQQQAYVKQILLTAWSSGVQDCAYSNMHMSNRYCWLLDHQEFKTVHTATGICQTDTAGCLIIRSSRLYILQQAYVKQILLTAWSSGVQDFTYSNRHMSNRYCGYPLASRQQYLFVIWLLLYVLYSLEILMMDGKTVRNM